MRVELRKRSTPYEDINSSGYLLSFDHPNPETIGSYIWYGGVRYIIWDRETKVEEVKHYSGLIDLNTKKPQYYIDIEPTLVLVIYERTE